MGGQAFVVCVLLTVVPRPLTGWLHGFYVFQVVVADLPSTLVPVSTFYVMCYCFFIFADATGCSVTGLPGMTYLWLFHREAPHSDLS